VGKIACRTINMTHRPSGDFAHASIMDLVAVFE
jgi:hypothetical protein